MKPNEIRAELLKNDVKIKDIASELGLVSPCISAVISGRRRTPKVREAIARAINKPVNEIWPPKETIK